MTQSALFSRLLLLVCISPLTLAAVRNADAENDTFPDWVRAAAKQTIPTYPPEINAVVLLDQTTLIVSKDGRAVLQHRHVVKILRPAGRENATVVMPFDKDSKLQSLHVWSIAPDGHEYAMKDSEMAIYSPPGEGTLYEDIRFKVAHAPGRDPGGVVAFESEQRRPDYLSEEDWMFQSGIPSLSESFTLLLPPGYTYGVAWAHHKAEPVIDLEGQRWRWELKDVPAVDLHNVPMSPSEQALAGRMSVHYEATGMANAIGGTWQSIGQWYGLLSKDRLQPTPEITAKTAELVAGKADFYDKTEAVSEFVQKQIRYFVVEKGIGGLQPHPAADIFRNRYGDCKDKATLLSAMLSTAGVHAALVMVDTERGFVDPDAPSLMGNHVIAAIEIPKGYDSPKMKSVVTAKTGRRYLIFDPTWEETAFGQLEHNLQGSYGVLVEGSDSQIISFPVLNPTQNTIHRSAHFQMEADGSMKGSIVEKRFGDVSEQRRMMYQSASEKEQRQYLDRQLQLDFSSFSVSGVKVENVAALNKELTMSFSLNASSYAKKMGPLLMVRPRILGSEGLRFNHETRKVPVDLSETMQVEDEYAIDVPDDYAVDELPEPVALDLGFAAYSSSSKMDGNTLRYKRTYTVRELTLPAERYSELQKLAGVIANDEASSAIFKKK